MPSRPFIIAAALLCATPALAQDFAPRLRPGAPDTIQSSLSMSVVIDAKRDIAAQHEEALRKLYTLASGSCRLVLETLAESCRIVNMTTNVRSDETREAMSRMTVTAQVMMQVEFSETNETKL